MNVQNAKNLTIEEGSVKTIHDKDNQLLWGAVGYDVKYKGNTSQTGTPAPTVPADIKCVSGSQSIAISDGKITENFTVDLTSKNLFDKNAITPNVYISSSGGLVTYEGGAASDYIPITPNMDYYISGRTDWDSVALYGETKNFLTRINLDYQSGILNITNTNCRYVRLNLSMNNVDSMQVEKGSSSSTYEEFFNYTLYKIGDVEDYIYKNGSNWYLHKVSKYIELTGSESWSQSSGYTSAFNIKLADIKAPSSSTVKYPFGLYSNRFVLAEVGYNGGYLTADYTGTMTVTTDSYLSFNYSAKTSTNAWRNWLRSPNVLLDVCYILNTPIDAQITNTNLISQLNTIESHLIHYGYSTTITGDLPIIINKTEIN